MITLGIKNKVRGIVILFCCLILSECQFTPWSNSFVGNNENPGDQSSRQNSLDTYKPDLVLNEQNILGSFKTATQYHINIRIDDDLTSITAHQDVVYTNQENIPLDKIYFDLIPNIGGGNLKVKNIQINGFPVTGSLVFQDSVLQVDLSKPLQPGEVLSISMDFLETVPGKMGGNYGLFIFKDNVLALDSFFPIIPVYDGEGWHVQNPPLNADMIYTDAAFFEVQVDAPDVLVLVASGVETKSKKENGRQIVTFAGGPQRDFYLAASSRFQSESMQTGEVKVTSFFPSENKGSGELVLNTAVKALQVFSRRYGSYPYTGLDLVSAPMLAGGMEYSGAAALALDLYKSGNTTSDAPNEDYLEYATAHEVAHQWFFNQVMNDQIEEPWLDEAFAQYLTYIYYLDTYGISASEQIRSSWEGYWSSVDYQPIPIGKPAGDYQPNEYTAIIYGRAPLFILELEKKMGSKVFSNFLADYVKIYRWKTADSQQFKSLAELSCSCDRPICLIYGELNINWKIK